MVRGDEVREVRLATKCGEHAAIVRFGVALRDDGRTWLEGWE